MLDPTDPAAYDWTPPADRAIVDAFEPVDLRPFQDRINKMVDDLNETLDEEPIGYDLFGAPLYAHQIAPEGQE